MKSKSLKPKTKRSASTQVKSTHVSNKSTGSKASFDEQGVKQVFKGAKKIHIANLTINIYKP